MKAGKIVSCLFLVLFLPVCFADTTTYLQNDEAIHQTYFGVHEAALVDPTIEIPTDVTSWNLLPATAIASGQYPDLWAVDGAEVDSPGIGWNGQWVNALFDFTIKEPVSSISQVDVQWVGRSPQDAAPPGGNDVYLLVYNRTLDQWEVLDLQLDDTCIAGCTLTGSITTDFDQYISSPLRVMATRSDWPIITTLYTDYIEITITFTPAAAAPAEGEAPKATCADGGGVECAFPEWCTKGYLTRGYADTPNCCLGTCVVPVEVSAGEKCTENSQCASGACYINACVECATDDQCGQTEFCSEDFECLPVECDCGPIEGHACTANCCSDEDCAADEFCKLFECQPIVPEYGPGVPPEGAVCGEIVSHQWVQFECCENEDCAYDQFCDTSAHACREIPFETCGYFKKHRWFPFECCEDGDCTIPGQACQIPEHKCVLPGPRPNIPYSLYPLNQFFQALYDLISLFTPRQPT